MPVEQQLPSVLIVDDEDLFRQMMELILSQEFSVVTAASVAEGLEAFEHYKPDAVLLDVVMPGTNGLSALKTIRKKDPDTPVLMVTGSPRYETIQEALEQGATRYIEKPISPEDLVMAVRQGIRLGREARQSRSARNDACQLFEELQQQKEELLRAQRAETASRSCVDHAVDQALTDLREVMNEQRLPLEAQATLTKTQLQLLCAKDLLALSGPLKETAAHRDTVHASALVSSALKDIEPWARAMSLQLDVQVKVGPSHTLARAGRQRKLIRSFLASVLLEAPRNSTVRGEMTATDEQVELRLLEPWGHSEPMLLPPEVMAPLQAQLQVRQADGRGRVRILLWH